MGGQKGRGEGNGLVPSLDSSILGGVRGFIDIRPLIRRPEYPEVFNNRILFYPFIYEFPYGLF